MGNKLKRDKAPTSFIIGLAVLVLLFFGTGGFFAYQNYQLKKQIGQIPINDKFFPAIKAELQKNVNFRRTGHYIIAKLISGKWKEIYSGQDIPSCKFETA